VPRGRSTNFRSGSYIDNKSQERHQLLWKQPVYATVNNLLTNPVYAGAYAFGRTGSRTTIENGHKRIKRGFRKDRTDWEVLLTEARYHSPASSSPDAADEECDDGPWNLT
jgi:hypothetical protein